MGFSLRVPDGTDEVRLGCIIGCVVSGVANAEGFCVVCGMVVEVFLDDGSPRAMLRSCLPQSGLLVPQLLSVVDCE